MAILYGPLRIASISGVRRALVQTMFVQTAQFLGPFSPHAPSRLDRKMPFVRFEQSAEPRFPAWCLMCGAASPSISLRVRRTDVFTIRAFGFTGLPLRRAVVLPLCADCARRLQMRWRFNRIFFFGWFALSYAVPFLYAGTRSEDVASSTLTWIWVATLIAGFLIYLQITRNWKSSTFGLRLYAGRWTFVWKDDDLAAAFALFNGISPTREFQM